MALLGTQSKEIECGTFVQLYVQFHMIIFNSHHLPPCAHTPKPKKYAAATFGLPNNGRKTHTKCLKRNYGMEKTEISKIPLSGC